MSRTFRRKNYEKTQGKTHGSKVAGYYTQHEYEWNAVKVVRRRVEYQWKVVRTMYGRVCKHTEVEIREVYTRYLHHVYYRAPTKRERDHEYWNIHGESCHANAWTPNRWHRQHRMNENRSINNQELHRFWKDPENYEVVCEANPRSHYWDWS